MVKKLCGLFAAVMVLIPSGECYAEGLAGIDAKAYVLMEESTGEILFEKDSDVKLPMASTTKIMTTLLCLESGDLDSQFVVDSEAIKTEGSSMGLQEGDIVTKRALCIGMLLPSGNDAANATAVKLGGSFEGFAKMMNRRAAEIGMTHTCFVTPSGLEADGHGASAHDMALLAREALKNDDFAEICSQQSMKLSFGNPPFDRWLKNTNRLLSMCEGVCGVKTGFTDEAGRCLVSACERNGVKLICVTLNDPDDYRDHEALYDKGFSMVEKYVIPSSDYEAAVAGGVKNTVRLKPCSSVSVGTHKGTVPDITEEVNIKHFLYAPVEKGTPAGRIDYYCNGVPAGSSELVTDEDVMIDISGDKKNIFEKTISSVYDFFSRIKSELTGKKGECL